MRHWPANAIRAAATLIAAVAIAALPADAAQPRQGSVVRQRPLEVGADISGELTTTDQLGDNIYYRSFQVNLRRDQPVVINLKSKSLDAYLDVIPPDAKEPLLSDDDGGGGLNARLRFTPPVSGIYTVRVQSADLGDFALSIKRDVPMKTSVEVLPEPADPNAPVSRTDTLVSAAPLLSGRYRYQMYSFEGKGGDLVRVDMKSSKFDPKLKLLRPENSLDIFNDDSTNNLNSRIYALLPASGTYTIYAMGGLSSEGEFTLEVQRIRRGVPDPTKSVEIGQTVTGSLEAATASLGSLEPGSAEVNFFYRVYSMQVTQGQAVEIQLSAEGFDPVVEVGAMSPVGFGVAAYNDDASGAVKDARLQFVPATSGPLLIRVRPIGTETGAYVLKVNGPAAR